MDVKDRERKIDVSSLDPEQVAHLSVQIGDRVREICDTAAKQINTILKIYGMSAQIAIVINELNDKKEEKIENSKEG